MKLKPQYIPIIIFCFCIFSSCIKKEEIITKTKSFPEIHIFTKDIITFNNYNKCLIIFENNGKICSRRSRIKCRGGYSSKFYKHSYRIELSKKYSPFELPKEDDWILNANYIDKTFNRHKLSYDLYKNMNSYNLAPECKYVNVNLNQNYMGLYVFMQRVNGKFCNINKKDKTACVFKDPPVFNISRLIKTDSINYYDQKFPEICDIDFTDKLDEFRNFLINSPDSVFAKEINNWVDLQNIIDWHILLLLTNNADGLVKNFYLYKIDKNTPFRIAIWDYDHSFGRDGDNKLNMLDSEIDCSKNLLFYRLMNCNLLTYKEILKSRWEELRDSKIISEFKINLLILQNHFIINSEIEKNFNKWPEDSQNYYDDNDYDDEVKIMIKYITLRIPQLDEYFHKLK